MSHVRLRSTYRRKQICIQFAAKLEASCKVSWKREICILVLCACVIVYECTCMCLCVSLASVCVCVCVCVLGYSLAQILLCARKNTPHNVEAVHETSHRREWRTLGSDLLRNVQQCHVVHCYPVITIPTGEPAEVCARPQVPNSCVLVPKKTQIRSSVHQC